jgi:hypothetical protein
MTTIAELNIEVNRTELDVLIKDLEAFQRRFVFAMVLGFGAGCVLGVAAVLFLASGAA